MRLGFVQKGEVRVRVRVRDGGLLRLGLEVRVRVSFQDNRELGLPSSSVKGWV